MVSFYFKANMDYINHYWL